MAEDPKLIEAALARLKAQMAASPEASLKGLFPEGGPAPSDAPWKMTREEFLETGTELMHGTSHEFATFEPIRNRYNKEQTLRRFYFTSKEGVAHTFANSGGYKSINANMWHAINEGTYDKFSSPYGYSSPPFPDSDDPQEVEEWEEMHSDIITAVREHMKKKGSVLVTHDPYTWELLELDDPAFIPVDDLFDGDVRLYSKDRWPTVIKTNVYGKELDLTDAFLTPLHRMPHLGDTMRALGTKKSEELIKVLEEEGKFKPWETFPNFRHEFSPALIQWARENGYGKIKVRDVSESKFESTIGLQEYIEYGTDPHRAIVEDAVKRGEPVPDTVVADYPDLAKITKGRAQEEEMYTLEGELRGSSGLEEAAEAADVTLYREPLRRMVISEIPAEDLVAMREFARPVDPTRGFQAGAKDWFSAVDEMPLEGQLEKADYRDRLKGRLAQMSHRADTLFPALSSEQRSVWLSQAIEEVADVYAETPKTRMGERVETIPATTEKFAETPRQIRRARAGQGRLPLPIVPVSGPPGTPWDPWGSNRWSGDVRPSGVPEPLDPTKDYFTKYSGLPVRVEAAKRIQGPPKGPTVGGALGTAFGASLVPALIDAGFGDVLRGKGARRHPTAQGEILARIAAMGEEGVGALEGMAELPMLPARLLLERFPTLTTSQSEKVLDPKSWVPPLPEPSDEPLSDILAFLSKKLERPFTAQDMEFGPLADQEAAELWAAQVAGEAASGLSAADQEAAERWAQQAFEPTKVYTPPGKRGTTVEAE